MLQAYRWSGSGCRLAPLQPEGAGWVTPNSHNQHTAAAAAAAAASHT
jgi:hypothetical protein